jgi:hypothetical protein
VTWQVITAANAVVALAYLAIATIIFRGLRGGDQLWSNRLGTATAFIFLTCGVHHGSHSVHMLLPSFGVDDPQALALREGWHWPSAVWDVFAAGVGVYYLSLRKSYASVLRGAQMFEDLRERERQAVEINDNIVQGLTVAKYALEVGRDDQSRKAVEDTLRKSQELISQLLGDDDDGVKPGHMRRAAPASVDASPAGSDGG